MVSLSQKKNKQDPRPDKDHQNSQQSKETDLIGQNIKIIHDPQAEAMKEATDPHQAIASLDRLLNEDGETS